MVLADSLYYGRLTFTPLNFIKANASPVSLFYGNNSHHYYISQAIPILCTTALPFTLHGMWMIIRAQDQRNTSLRTMLIAIAWTVVIYSFAGHKEWRFIHPILPLLHIFAAKSLIDLSYEPVRMSTKGSKPGGRITRWKPKATPAERTFLHRLLDLPDIPTKYLKLLLATLPVSFYVVALYCSGPISVLSYIRSIPRHELKQVSIGILMPCHSTPGHAYLHRPELANGALWSLGCEPPLTIDR
jgi:phosphatidylinositol glycan class B